MSKEILGQGIVEVSVKNTASAGIKSFASQMQQLAKAVSDVSKSSSKIKDLDKGFEQASSSISKVTPKVATLSSTMLILAKNIKIADVSALKFGANSSLSFQRMLPALKALLIGTNRLNAVMLKTGKSNGFLKWNQSVNKSSGSVKRLTQDLGSLNQALVRVNKTSSGIGRNFNQGFKASGQTLLGFNKTAKNTRFNVSKLGEDVTDLSNAAKAANTPFQSLGTSLQMTSGELFQISMVMGAISASIGVLVTSIGGLAYSFDSNMAMVKAVTGSVGKEFDRLKTISRDVGKVSEYGAVKSAEALLVLSRMGLKAADSMKVLEPTVKLAQSQQHGLAETTELVVQQLRVFGKEMDSASSFANVLAAISSRTAADLSKLTMSLSYAGPIAKTAGVSFEDLNIALGIMYNNGIKASRAGTSLRYAMASLLGATKKSKDGFEAIGIKMEDIDLKTNSLGSVFELLAEKLAGTEDKAGALFKIFGVRATPAIAAVTNALEKDILAFERLRWAITDTAEVERQYNIQMNSFSGVIKLINSNIKELGLQFSDVFMPTLRMVTDSLFSAIKAFQDLSPAIKSFIGFGVLSTGIFTGLIAIVASTALAFKMFSGAMMAANKAVTVLIKNAGVLIYRIVTLKFAALKSIPVMKSFGMAFNAMGGWLTVAIVAVSVLTSKWLKHTAAVKDAKRKNDEYVTTMKGIIDKTEKMKTAISELTSKEKLSSVEIKKLAALTDELRAEQMKLVTQNKFLLKSFDSTTGKLTVEAQGVTTLISRYKKLRQAKIDAANEKDSKGKRVFGSEVNQEVVHQQRLLSYDLEKDVEILKKAEKSVNFSLDLVESSLKRSMKGLSEAMGLPIEKTELLLNTYLKMGEEVSKYKETMKKKESMDFMQVGIPLPNSPLAGKFGIPEEKKISGVKFDTSEFGSVFSAIAEDGKKAFETLDEYITKTNTKLGTSAVMAKNYKYELVVLYKRLQELGAKESDFGSILKEVTPGGVKGLDKTAFRFDGLIKAVERYNQLLIKTKENSKFEFELLGLGIFEQSIKKAENGFSKSIDSITRKYDELIAKEKVVKSKLAVAIKSGKPYDEKAWAKVTEKIISLEQDKNDAIIGIEVLKDKTLTKMRSDNSTKVNKEIRDLVVNNQKAANAVASSWKRSYKTISADAKISSKIAINALQDAQNKIVQEYGLNGIDDAYSPGKEEALKKLEEAFQTYTTTISGIKKKAHDETLALIDEEVEEIKKKYKVMKDNESIALRIKLRMMKEYLALLKDAGEEETKIAKDAALAIAEITKELIDKTFEDISDNFERIAGNMSRILHAMADIDPQFASMVDYFDDITLALNGLIDIIRGIASEDYVTMAAGIVELIIGVIGIIAQAEDEREAEEKKKRKELEDIASRLDAMAKIEADIRDYSASMAANIAIMARETGGLSSSQESNAVELDKAIKKIDSAIEASVQAGDLDVGDVTGEDIQKWIKRISDPELLKEENLETIAAMQKLLWDGSAESYEKLAEIIVNEKANSSLIKRIIKDSDISRDFGIIKKDETNFEEEMARIAKVLEVGTYNLYKEVWENVKVSYIDSFGQTQHRLERVKKYRLTELGKWLIDLKGELGGIFAENPISIGSAMTEFLVAELLAGISETYRKNIAKTFEDGVTDPEIVTALQSILDKFDSVKDIVLTDEKGDKYSPVAVSDYMTIVEKILAQKLKMAETPEDVKSAYAEYQKSIEGVTDEEGSLFGQLSGNMLLDLADKLGGIDDAIAEAIAKLGKDEEGVDVSEKFNEGAEKIIDAFNKGVITYKEAVDQLNKLGDVVKSQGGDYWNQIEKSFNKFLLTLMQGQTSKIEGAEDGRTLLQQGKTDYKETLKGIAEEKNEVISLWNDLLKQQSELEENLASDISSAKTTSSDKIKDLERERELVIGTFNFQETQNQRSKRFQKAKSIEVKILDELVSLQQTLNSLQEKYIEDQNNLTTQIQELVDLYGSLAGVDVAFQDRINEATSIWKDTVKEVLDMYNEITGSDISKLFNVEDLIGTDLDKMTDFFERVYSRMLKRMGVGLEGMSDLEDTVMHQDFVNLTDAIEKLIEEINTEKETGIEDIKINEGVGIGNINLTKREGKSETGVILKSDSIKGLGEKGDTDIISAISTNKVRTNSRTYANTEMGSLASSKVGNNIPNITIVEQIDLRGAYGITDKSVAERVYKEVWNPARRRVMGRYMNVRGKAIR